MNYRRAIDGVVAPAVEAVNADGVPIFWVLFIKQVDGLETVLVGGGAIGVNEHQNQVGNTGASLLQIDFLELEGGNLGGFGNFIALCHQVVELLVVKIHPAE